MVQVQIFDLECNFLGQWHAHRAVAVQVGGHADIKASYHGQDHSPVLLQVAEVPNAGKWVYIAEQGSTSNVQKGDGMNALPTYA